MYSKMYDNHWKIKVALNFHALKGLFLTFSFSGSKYCTTDPYVCTSQFDLIEEVENEKYYSHSNL